jgi:phosphomannomutase
MIPIVNLLALKKRPLSELNDPLRRYSATGEINTHGADKDRIMDALEKRFADGAWGYLDGFSINYETWWFNLGGKQLMRWNQERKRS